LIFIFLFLVFYFLFLILANCEAKAKQSALGHLANLRPLFCRVPSRAFTRWPWYSYTRLPVPVCGTVHASLTLWGFSGKPAQRSSSIKNRFPATSWKTLRQQRESNNPPRLLDFVPPLKKYVGAGILTGYPSPTPFGFG